MPAIDIPTLLKQMLTAAQGTLGTKWPAARDYASSEFTKLLLEAQNIAILKTKGTINEQEATLLMGMQRNASRAVLLTIKGLGLIAAQQAIDAALSVVRTTINTALGFALL
jgi:hypothetical protein